MAENKYSGLDPLAQKILSSFEFSLDHFKTVRQQSEELDRYLQNQMFSETEKTAAKKFSKPILVYNMMRGKLLALIGNEQLSARKGQVKAVNNEQEELVLAIQARYERLNDEEGIEDIIQGASADAFIRPIGGYVIRRFKLTPDGYVDFTWEIGDGYQIHLDPKTNMRDYDLKKTCKWVILEDFQTLDFLKEVYNLDTAISHMDKSLWKDWWNKLSETIKKLSDGGRDTDGHHDSRNDTYRRLEMREYLIKKVYVVIDENEEMVTLTQGEYNKRKKDVQKIFADTERVVHITTLLPFFDNAIVMDEDDRSPAKNFGVFRVSSFRDNVPASEGTSLMHTIKDPQDDINKAKSQFREYMSKLISGGLIVSQHEAELLSDLQERGNQPGFVGKSKGDPSQAVYQLNMGNAPSAEAFLQIQDSQAMVDKISLLNEAMVGGPGKSGESGVLFEQKVERAAAAINPYYKNISLLRKIILEDFVDNFGYVYSEINRPMTGKGEDGKLFQTILNLQYGYNEIKNETNNLSAYVELDEGQDSVTVREENFNRLLAWYNILLQANPQAASVAALPLLQLAPIWGKDKIIDVINQSLEAQAQDAEVQKELEMTKEALDMQEQQQKIAIDGLEARANLKTQPKDGKE